MHFPETYECRKKAIKLNNDNPFIKEKKRNTSSCKKVIQEDINGNIIEIYRSANEAKRILGYDVSAQCRGLYKTTYKNRLYRFRYANPDRDGILIAEYGRRKNL